MRLVKYINPATGAAAVGLLDGPSVVPLGEGGRLDAYLHADDPAAAVAAARRGDPLQLDAVKLLAPIDDHEVWGAGVTYERSKLAREEESAQAATFYDQVYTADRPELFFKATPSRVAGPGAPIRVRADSRWSVPEPELGVVLSPSLGVVGYTIGDDVSARDIEGRNPLYLPQAKVYAASCGLGPCVTLAHALPDVTALPVRLTIRRGGAVAFDGETSTARLARSIASLVDWLGRENIFPGGVVLLTGTGVVPPDDFHLSTGDVVEITIEGIGTLVNPVG